MFLKTASGLQNGSFKEKCLLKTFVSTFKPFSMVIIQVPEDFVIQI